MVSGYPMVIEYFIHVAIGTPPQEIDLVLDTGKQPGFKLNSIARVLWNAERQSCSYKASYVDNSTTSVPLQPRLPQRFSASRRSLLPGSTRPSTSALMASLSTWLTPRRLFPFPSSWHPRLLPPRRLRLRLPVVCDSAYGFDDSHLFLCEEEILVMCQVESVHAVPDIEAFAAVEGVDMVYMGSLDLSEICGILGTKKARQVLREVERSVLGARKKRMDADAAAERGVGGASASAGGLAMPQDPAEELKATRPRISCSTY